MRNILLGLGLVCVIAGCGEKERIVYEPRPVAPADTASRKTPDPKPKWSPPAVKPDYVQKVGAVDLSPFAIPVYPGATIEKDLVHAEKPGKAGTKTIQVTLDAFGSVSEITDWYSKQIKPENAYVVGAEGGALDGTTTAGYKIRISIVKIESKTVIAATVEDTRRK
jgi:hypothetical protein